MQDGICYFRFVYQPFAKSAKPRQNLHSTMELFIYLLQTPQEGSIKSDFVSFCNSQQNQCCKKDSVPSNSRRSRLRSVSVDNIQTYLNVSESNLTRARSFETPFKEKRSKTASPEIKVTTDDVFIKPKRPSYGRKCGTIMRNKAKAMGRSLSFKSNKKPIEKPEFKKKWASTGEQPPRKFSIRKKRSKEDDFCMEYRKNALEILEKETPVKVQKL